ncbi:MAG: FHA domain-containing protein [Anaerolineales bacterium]|nr:FHA domain-containing protein [Anaerolineales bacterium]MCB9126854.1 FHA domain-containing protein [Ardenticatenales bacterium]MCB9172835.1 FHA domain-containing protein [Ardenticatenales bacterium]
MAQATKRLSLLIRIPGEDEGQRAEALPTLTLQQLIAHTLREFRDNELLVGNPHAYSLEDGAGETLPLDIRLGELMLDEGTTLTLVEKPQPIPKKAQRAAERLYLREVRQSESVRLHWLPAVVGRRSEQLADNDLLVLDLSNWPSGQRVSRRHVALVQEDGYYVVQLLSANPVTLWRNDQPVVTLSEEGERHPIEAGDLIKFDRSDIQLKFIVQKAG